MNVEIWERAGLHQVGRIHLCDCGSDFSGRVALSPDGRILAATDCDTRVILFDLGVWLDAGAPPEPLDFPRLREFPFRAAICRALAFSQDGRYLLAGSTQENKVVIWDRLSGETVRECIRELWLGRYSIPVER